MSWARNSCSVLFPKDTPAQTAGAGSGRCGKGALVQFGPQCHLPAHVKVRSSFGLIIRNPIVRLEQQGRRQEAWRNTIPPIIRTIQPAEVLVPKEVPSLRGQEAIERVPSHKVEVYMIRFADGAGTYSKHPALRRSLPEHQALPFLPLMTTPGPDQGFTFRPDF